MAEPSADIDTVLEQLAGELEGALALVSGADAEQRLAEVTEHCRKAAVLAERGMSVV